MTAPAAPAAGPARPHAQNASPFHAGARPAQVLETIAHSRHTGGSHGHVAKFPKQLPAARRTHCH